MCGNCIQKTVQKIGIVVRCSQSTAYVGPPHCKAASTSRYNFSAHLVVVFLGEVSRKKNRLNPTNKVVDFIYFISLDKDRNRHIFKKHISEMPFAVGQQAPVWFFFAQAGIAAQSLEDSIWAKFQQKGTSGWECYRATYFLVGKSSG